MCKDYPPCSGRAGNTGERKGGGAGVPAVCRADRLVLSLSKHDTLYLVRTSTRVYVLPPNNVLRGSPLPGLWVRRARWTPLLVKP